MSLYCSRALMLHSGSRRQFSQHLETWSTTMVLTIRPSRRTSMQISLGALDMGAPGEMDSPDDMNTFIFAHLLSADAGRRVNYTGEPFSSIYIPIMDSLDAMREDGKPVAILLSIIRWASYFEEILTANQFVWSWRIPVNIQ